MNICVRVENASPKNPTYFYPGEIDEEFERLREASLAADLEPYRLFLDEKQSTERVLKAALLLCRFRGVYPLYYRIADWVGELLHADKLRELDPSVLVEILGTTMETKLLNYYIETGPAAKAEPASMLYGLTDAGMYTEAFAYLEKTRNRKGDRKFAYAANCLRYESGKYDEALEHIDAEAPMEPLETLLWAVLIHKIGTPSQRADAKERLRSIPDRYLRKHWALNRLALDERRKARAFLATYHRIQWRNVSYREVKLFPRKLLSPSGQAV